MTQQREQLRHEVLGLALNHHSDREARQIRQVLSVSFVRAQSTCLLSRVGYLGEGVRSAADWRLLANHSAQIWGCMGRVGDLFVLGLTFNFKKFKYLFICEA